MAFALFSAGLVFSIVREISIIIPLLFGLVCFAVTARCRGHSFPSVAKMAGRGMKKSLIVLRIFVLIGLLTAVWRAGGTVSFFVYYGIQIINPHFFILFAFVLTSLVSYALGTCFGAAGTIGVVLMVLARSGGADPVVTAGAVVSGAFFGDRCAPTSSSANLVANLTGTRLYDNIRLMFKTAFLPTLLTLAVYLYFSLKTPMENADASILSEIVSLHRLGFAAAFPALIIFVLPFLGFEVKSAMLLSILAGTLASVGVQKVPAAEILRVMVMGYRPDVPGRFAGIMAGGGLLSMARVAAIVLIASTYSGIFQGAGLLDGIQRFLERMSRRLSLYSVTAATGVVTNMFACNQTLSVMLTHQLMQGIYEREKRSPTALALDLEDTAILVAGLVPWSVAVAVPLTMLASDLRSIPYAVFLWLVPTVNLFLRRPG